MVRLIWSGMFKLEDGARLTFGLTIFHRISPTSWRVRSERHHLLTMTLRFERLHYPSGTEWEGARLIADHIADDSNRECQVPIVSLITRKNYRSRISSFLNIW